MSMARSILSTLCTTLALAGCGRDDSNAIAPPSTGPATQKSIKERIAELTDTGPLPTTRAATEPATTQASTRPLRPELDPMQTVAAIFKHVKARDFTDVREMILEAPLSADLQRQFAGASSAMESGRTVYEPFEEKVAFPIAMVLIRVTTKDQSPPLYTPLMLYNKQGHWLVMLAQPNLRRFTIGERQRINDLSEWAKARLSTLEGPSTTQSTTGPATTRASR